MSRRLERARLLLARPGAWLEEGAGGYGVRLGPDRRARVALRLSEAEVHALVAAPGLRPRSGGGWTARPGGPASRSASGSASRPTMPPPGRPGVIEGQAPVMEPDGRVVLRRANLGESPIAWLARRRDADGRPWLDAAQVAAGERLRALAETALAGPSLTMRWDALPRAGGGSAARVEPGDRAMGAAARLEAALSACGPRLRPVLEEICVRGSSLRLAEQALGLPRRHGKTALRVALSAAADHFGLPRPSADGS